MASITPCPFLYNTRTILNCSRRARALSRATYTERSSRCLTQSASQLPPITQDEPPTSFLKQKAQGVLIKKAEAASRSTMTPAERAAFDDIWRLFRTAPDTPSSSSPSASTDSSTKLTQQPKLVIDENDTNWKSLLELFTTEQQSSSEPADIAEYLSEHPEFQPQTPESIELRNTIESIISDVAASSHKALKSKKIKPDIALWEVCEAKVFPLIKLLVPPQTSLSNPPRIHTPSSVSFQRNVPDPAASISTPTATKTATTTTSDEDNDNDNESNYNTQFPIQQYTTTTYTTPGTNHPQIPSKTPTLPILTLVYPTLLLLTLRLLSTHTPGSPYLSSLLPTIKSLGPTSYILGTSTYFYNTLLRVRWETYSDLKNVVELLGEMERNGVDFNGGTLEFVRGVERERRRCLGMGIEDGMAMVDETGRDAVWWGRWEVQRRFKRVEEWQGRISRQLHARGSTGEVVSEDWPAEFADDGKSEVKPEYVVTL